MQKYFLQAMHKIYASCVIRENNWFIYVLEKCTTNE